jgi:hypothetical protein
MARRLRFIRDRRAITPVLSNLLLTVIAVAAMAIATTATYVITTNLRETMSERVIIEDIWFSSSTGNIRVCLHNVGKVSIHVSQVYVNHTSEFYDSLPVLEISAHAWLNVSCSWTTGSLYYVDVVTSRGTHVGGYYEAP